MLRDLSLVAPANSVAYVNASVLTMDPLNPRASGFIVSGDGLFTHIGSTEEVTTIAKQAQIIIVDLRGNFTMPGLHDAHAHNMAMALALSSDANIGANVTHLNFAERVKEGACACEYMNVYQDWILAGFYSSEGFPNTSIDRKYLDDQFPHTPVAIAGGAGHGALLNTAALEASGYDVDNEPDVPGSRFLRRQDGSLTGELGETAMNKFKVAQPQPGTPHAKRAFRHAIRLAHQAGITSTQEASANSMMLRALKELDNEKALKLDIYTHLVHGPEWVAGEPKEASAHLIDTAEKYASEHVHTNYVKIILDGVPLPPFFSHAPLNADGTADSTNFQVLDIPEAILKYDQRGMTVKVHCTGQGATRYTLDAIENVRKTNPNGPRHEVAHNSGVHEEDYNRYATLNVTAEMSPAAFFRSDLERISQGLATWDVGKMQAAKAHITIGTDWGAVPDRSILQNLGSILEELGNGSRQASAETVCRMLTINGAQAVGREKEVGSFEVGKKANFIVVDRDLSVGDFAGAQVLRTYFEGEKVWDAAVGIVV